jgi:hypothetical protein
MMQRYVFDKGWSVYLDPIHGMMEYTNNESFLIRRREVEDGKVVHLLISRLDGRPVHDWYDLQEIKNSLGFKDRWAIELYPPESKLVDLGNVYHLWIFLTEDPFPFAYQTRAVVPNARYMRQISLDHIRLLQEQTK